jgi:addiction module HigA family antidote
VTDLAPTHPGEVIRQVLIDHSMKQTDLARATGLTPKHICRILNGKSGIGTHAAHLIGPALDLAPSFLIHMQADWDVAHHKPRPRS